MMYWKAHWVALAGIIMTCLKYSFAQNACDISPCRNGATCVESVLEPYYVCLCNAQFNGQQCEQSAFFRGDCGSGTDSYTPSGTVTSPNYPSNYTRYLDCFYNIRVANATSLTFTFSHLEIERYKDFIEIAPDPFFIDTRDENTNVPVNLTFNGYYVPPPPPFTLDTNQVVILFTSDKNVNLKGWSLSYEATLSPCATNPCENGGSCLHLPPNNYQCLCSNEWQGVNCSIAIDPCFPNPCLNEATCDALSLTEYACTCVVGWTGDLCDRGLVIITDTDLVILSGDPVTEGTSQPSFTVNINLTPAASSFQLTGTDLWRFEFYYSNQNDGSGSIIGSGSALLTPLQASTAWIPPNVASFNSVAVSTSLGDITCSEYRYLCVNVRKGTASSVDYDFVGVPDLTALNHCADIGCRGVEISGVRLSLLTSEFLEGVSIQPIQFNLELESVAEAGSVSGSNLWKFTMFGSASSSGFGSPRISSTTATQTPDHRNTPVNAGILAVFNNLQGIFNLNQIICPQVPYFCVQVEKGDTALPDFTFSGVPDESVLTACVPVLCIGLQITRTYFNIDSGAVFIERSLSHSVDFSSFFTTSFTGGSVSGNRLWQVQSFTSSSADGRGQRYSLSNVPLTDQQASVGNIAGSSSSLQQLTATFNLDGTKCSQIMYMCVTLDKGPNASPNFTLDPLPDSEVLTSCTAIECNGVIVTTIIPRIIRGLPIQYGYSSNSFICELTVSAKSDGASIAGSGLWNIVAYVNNQEDGRGARAAEQHISLTSAHMTTSLAAGGQAFFSQLEFNFDLSGVGSCDDVMFLCFELQKANSSIPDFTLEGSTTTCVSISCQEYNACDSNPCSNGGTCFKIGEAFTCTCAVGWTGPVCTEVIDNCIPNPCLNGGMCVNQVASYSCLCPFGWRGPNCGETDTGVEISDTRVLLESGYFRQSSATNTFLLDVFLQATATSALASGSGLWKGKAFASSSSSGSGIRYAEQDITFDSVQAATSIVPNTVRLINNVMLDFDFSNRVCMEGQYLCVEVQKGDNPVPDFILTGVPSSDALVGCVEVTCLGVEITGIFSGLPRGFEVVERTSSQPINFALNIVSDRAAGSVAGLGLWKLFGYFTSSSDNFGVPQVQQIPLDAIQAATGITAGEVATIQNIAASMNLDGVCAEVGYFCLALARGDAPSVDFKLEETSQLSTCIEVTCRGVGITSTSFTATSGLLKEGSANHPFTFDLLITSDPQGASVQGTNLWNVELFSSFDQFGTKNNVIDQAVPLTSQQSGTGLVAGVPVTLQNVMASLDLSTVTCADIPFLCTRLSRSVLASTNFTLESYPDGDRLTNCRTVRCEEPNTPPYFLFGGDFDNIVIPENSQPGTVVYTLRAGDNEGDVLTYGLVGDLANQLFQVNSMTGEVTLRTNLDSENVNVYNISVSVSDGQETVIEYSTVFVGDVNDNAPVFIGTPYTTTVQESQAPNSVIFQVEARDPDSGQNGAVTYQLAEASELFEISPLSGEITLIGTLNFEESASYQLRVRAYDGGVPRMESEEEVIITVGDVQDSDPVFVNLPYSPTLDEETPVGSVVQVVSAEDPDVNNPNVIQYSIISGNEQGFFSINSSTGELTLANMIDLESGAPSAFTVVVRATEIGPTGGASAITEFTISVADVNDNLPVFNAPVYVNTISELSPVNTPLNLGISVNDADMGVNSAYFISLRGPNRNLFSVAPTSGIGMSTPVVSLASTLDYETSSSYTVEIYATDANDPTRETSSTIIVNLMNENDNSPFFSPSSYRVSILENVAVGAMVLRVTATDNDGDPVTYEISDNPSFTIDAVSGNITTTQELNYEDSTQHIFTVLASDNKNPPRTATAQVIVNVENVNDNAPQFPRDRYDLNTFENENYGPGNPLLTLQATDTDMDPTNLPVYSFLVPSPDGGTMKVSEYMGLRIETVSGVGYVYTASPLDYDVLDGPIIATVIAEDSDGLSDTTTLNIVVLDTNDNAPVFNQSLYSFTIPENIPPGQSIFQVVATDGDRSPQYGTPSLRYYIQPPSSTFSIFQSTGQILTVRSLDYEAGDTSYELQVIAIDSSQPNEMTGTTTVSITVEDVNDNDPQFNPIFQQVTVMEEQGAGVFVADVNAFDRDSTGPNGDITYSIISGNTEEAFTIDGMTGEIRTSAVLNYENIQSYTLRLLAENNATAVSPASGSSTGTVIVSVVDINDNSPQFVGTPYAFEVSEDRSPVSTIGVVSAVDRDSGVNGDITYSIIAGNIENSAVVFQVDPNSGEVTLHQSLDRETRPSYSLTIQAADGGASPRIALVNVPVTVLDVNDNSPVWIQDTYDVSITENSAAEEVVQVIATDADIGPNSKLIYEILSPSPYFTINNETGQISTTGPIDREAGSTIGLIVSVRDSGFPSRQATPFAQVNFEIIDVNDNAPVFEELNYVFEVEENQPNGTIVGQISATDLDPSDHLTYSLQGFDEVFTIDSNSGNITTLRPLNQEDVSSYTLIGRVSDGQNIGQASIVVTVLDLNDNVPVLNIQSENVTVSEGDPSGTFVTRVIATDEDSNLPITSFSITNGNINNAFIIKSSGEIETLRSLDRELIPYYSLTIEATDREIAGVQLTGTGTVGIIVTDVNDNGPRFIQNSYSISVPENVNQQTLVTVQATDADEELNAQINYRIILGNINNAFEIDSITGAIRRGRAPLDREFIDAYSLEVEASNPGSNLPPDYVRVNIAIEDINDEVPVFSQLVYQRINLDENSPVGTFVISVIATDSDTGAGGEVKYFIDQGNEDGKFFLNEDTGEITVANTLNFESVSNYTLSISARDQASPFNNGTATVIIQLSNVNEQTQFSQTQYREAVPEDTPPGNVVLQVFATDPDNKAIIYSISSNTPSSIRNLFTINSTTGEIKTNGPLDREDIDLYTFNVLASDGGAGEGSAEVRIDVIDVNDNTPTFDVGPVVLVSIPENVDVNYPVTSFRATDPDADVNGQVTYRIESGNNPTTFYLYEGSNNLVQLRTSRLLDREAQMEYSIVVVVSDGGSPPLNNSIRINVTLEDVNDNPPEFTENSYTGLISENAADGTPVVNVSATDADTGNNARLTYFIVSGNQGNAFQIDRNTGEITTTANPTDREQLPVYNLMVQVRDDGIPQFSDSVPVTITILDQNDNTPVFDPASVTYMIPEGPSSLGVTFGPITANDDDDGENGRILYTLLDGNGTFIINSATGWMMVVSELDRETAASYILTVTGVDQAVIDADRLTGTATVTVIVEDLNDNAPSFEQPSYGPVDIGEEQQGQVIGVYTATDDDEMPVITYSIDSISQGLFEIDPNTGVLMLRPGVTLDYESETSHVIIITASDDGNPPLTGMTMVTVSVTNINDNTPEFEGAPYEADVNDDSPPGTFITQITANDADNQTGGLLYNIIQGNPDGLYRIDPMTGIVYLNRSAGNYGDEMFSLTVEVSDNPTDPSNAQTSITTLTVTVVSVEKPPELASSLFIGSVDEGVAGAPVTMVPAISVLGDPSQVTYSITGPDSDYFNIDPATGQLTTNSSLDADTKNLYDFEIVATNSKGEADTADVQVIITNLNDNFPVFLPPQMSINISEGTVGGDIIGQVNASDPDGFPITYFISSGSEGKFIIDPNTGVIRVAPGETIDGTSSYTLIISAIDGGNPTQTTTSVVTINVENINNSPPYFPSDQLYRVVIIPEDTPVGENVVNITAMDDDNDADLEYAITNSVMYDSGGREVMPSATPRSNTQNLFVLNSQTGELTVDVGLDRELVETVRLTIKATDKNSADQSQADSVIDAIVLIQITDINDNTPVIEQLNVTALVIDVTENEDRGTLLTTIVASDADKDANGMLEYLLIDEDTGLVGLIRETGHLVVNGEIDYEQVQWFNFTVRVQDMGMPPLYTSIPVFVRVIDVNDNSPVFQDTPYETVVSESAGIGDPVGVTVHATDQDSGSFGEVVYTLSGGNGRFSIDQNTGEIFVANQLDGNQNEYFVTVTATDNPNGASTDRLTATVGVTIGVVIDNKFTPIPDKSTYYFDILENTPASTFVGEVHATDNDIGQAGELTYALSDTSPEVILSHLMINENLGVILTTAPFDREVDGDRLEFTVVISDNGTPIKSSTANVILTIKDVNDNPPVFDSTTYSISVPEGLVVGSPVYTVMASDSDTNSSVTYSIVQGNIGNAFKIDPSSGELTNDQVLDFDTVNRYNLTIAATDQGGMFGTTQLFIDILDLQIGSITFSETIYRASLAEDVPTDTYVNQVSVNDNGKPVVATFSIVDGNEDGAFIIDPNTGIITTNKTLDSETNSQYFIVIEAKTDDTIAQALLQVVVTDVNDQTPVFQQASYSVRILENTEVGMEVEEVMAVDNDADGGTILYSIISGNDDGHFRIDNTTGKIYLMKILLDRIPMEFLYELVVEAQDSANSQLSSTITVSIEIIDINDHAPVFIMPSEGEVLTVPENEPVGYIVSYVRAMDVDLGRNAEIIYDFLRTEDVSRDWESFTINATSGEIQTSVMFDREEKDLYTLVVVASDQGVIQLATPHEITVLISDRDDNLPVFEQLVPGVPIVETMDVDENSLVGTVIGVVPSATDRDTDVYSKTYYYIVEGNSENLFAINKTTGQLTVNGEIDRELESSYRIVVKASSDSDYTVSGPYNVTSDFSLKEILININDKNDNGPKFTQNPYFAAVAIDATVGKSIIRVSAVDPDVGDETILYDLTYSNIFGNSIPEEAPDYFSIDRETGLIFLNKDLTSMKTGYFEVGLLAEDATNTDLRDMSILQVNLLKKDERIILIIDASVDVVRSKEAELTELLSNLTGGMAVIDSIKTYIDADGVAHLDQSEVSFHVINERTGAVEDGAEVEKVIQANYDEIQKLFNISAYYALSDINGGSDLGFFAWMWLILAILIFLAALIAALLLCCCVRRKKVGKNEDYHLAYWKGKKVRKVDEYGMDVLSSDSGIGGDEADRGKKNLYELQEVTLNMDNDMKDNRQIQMTSFITPSGSTGGYINRGYERLGESASTGNITVSSNAGGFHGVSNGGLHGVSNGGFVHSQQNLQQNAGFVHSQPNLQQNAGFVQSQQNLQQNGGLASVHIPGQQNISIRNINPVSTTTSFSSHSNFGNYLDVGGTGVRSTRHSAGNLKRVDSEDSLFSQGSVTVKVGSPSNQGPTVLKSTLLTTPLSSDWQQSSTIHVPDNGSAHKDSFLLAKSEPNLVQHPNGFHSNSLKTRVEKRSSFRDGGSVHEEYTRTEETSTRLLPATYVGNNLGSTSMLQNIHFHDISSDEDYDPKDRYAYAYNVEEDRLSLSDSDGQ